MHAYPKVLKSRKCSHGLIDEENVRKQIWFEQQYAVEENDNECLRHMQYSFPLLYKVCCDLINL